MAIKIDDALPMPDPYTFSGGPWNGAPWQGKTRLPSITPANQTEGYYRLDGTTYRWIKGPEYELIRKSGI